MNSGCKVQLKAHYSNITKHLCYQFKTIQSCYTRRLDYTPERRIRGHYVGQTPSNIQFNQLKRLCRKDLQGVTDHRRGV